MQVASPASSEKQQLVGTGFVPSLASGPDHLAALSPVLSPLTLEDKHRLSKAYFYLGKLLPVSFLADTLNPPRVLLVAFFPWLQGETTPTLLH